jgi:hypothetical protein
LFVFYFIDEVYIIRTCISPCHVPFFTPKKLSIHNKSNMVSKLQPNNIVSYCKFSTMFMFEKFHKHLQQRLISRHPYVTQSRYIIRVFMLFTKSFTIWPSRDIEKTRVVRVNEYSAPIILRFFQPSCSSDE